VIPPSCHASAGWHPANLTSCVFLAISLSKSFSGKIMKNYYVYILASKRNGTLYTGVTSDLIKRTWQHKAREIKGFTSKYGVDQLVYYEIHSDIMEAIKREKNIQAWKRNWKLRLIEEKNPNWDDLYSSIL
jgi:putative endonuclease